MSRWSGRRGQAEPLAALAALLAVCLGVSLYAGVAVDAVQPEERSTAEPALERAAAEVVEGGAVDPRHLSEGAEAAPEGHQLRITVRTAEESWQIGPTAPENAAVAKRPVGVRVAPGTVRPGTLVVEVWT